MRTAASTRVAVGENGAGKSTLVKIIAGVYQPDVGRFRLGGLDVQFRGSADARAHGIAVIHQEPSLFPDLDVAENVFMGHTPTDSFGRVDWRAMYAEARRLFESEGVSLDVAAPVRGLSVADQQLIEIAKALSQHTHILVMDEPTASLSSREVERLFAIVRQMRERGVAVLFVSHRLEEIFALSDDVTVLRDGRLVITAPASTLTVADTIGHMVGHRVDTLYPKEETGSGDVVLEVSGLSRAGVFHDVGFSLRRGEILGFAGLVGAGRTEIARVLFGIDRADAGQIRVGGRLVHIDSPARALDHGIAYVPEDRREHGLILNFSVAENITLPILRRLSRGLVVERKREHDLAERFMQRLLIRAASVDQPAGALSGGNQQKVVLAKWLAVAPSILILDEPTRGIDIGAKAEVHRIMSHLAGQGMAIMLISSELPEILAMADRILVMHEGRIMVELDRREATQERVMYAATGQKAQRGDR